MAVIQGTGGGVAPRITPPPIPVVQTSLRAINQVPVAPKPVYSPQPSLAPRSTINMVPTLSPTNLSPLGAINSLVPPSPTYYAPAEPKKTALYQPPATAQTPNQTHRAGDVGQATGRSDIYVAPESAARLKTTMDMVEASNNILAGINNYIPSYDGSGGSSGRSGGWGYGGYGGGGGYTGIVNGGLYAWRIAT